MGRRQRQTTTPAACSPVPPNRERLSPSHTPRAHPERRGARRGCRGGVTPTTSCSQSTTLTLHTSRRLLPSGRNPTQAVCSLAPRLARPARCNTPTVDKHSGCVVSFDCQSHKRQIAWLILIVLSLLSTHRRHSHPQNATQSSACLLYGKHLIPDIKYNIKQLRSLRIFNSNHILRLT